ncbi:MAG: hypothetical protein L3V56_10185 [Candidatus Magnetoovum sp. WYHC-5]|nr:hypothetical protein [Candidatus Magnetoovum sp. WYHC-5]
MNLRYYILIVLFSCGLALNSSIASELEVVVDASANTEEFSDVLSANIWISNLDQRKTAPYIVNKFFKENEPAIIQLTMPFLRQTTNSDDFKIKIKEYFSTPIATNFIERVKTYDPLVIVGYDPCPMPSWISSRSGDFTQVTEQSNFFDVQSCSPPKDYELWAEVVKYTVEYLKGLGIKRLGFYVGHEPNRDWLGSEEEFFLYYKTTASAIKAVDANVVVGGIGSWDYLGKKVECNYDGYTTPVKELCNNVGGWANLEGDTLTKRFIEYVAKNALPIDFINWHSFGFPPSGFVTQSKTIRQWLKANGVGNVYLYPSDWTYWSDNYPADYLDTTENAAYIISSIYYMWKAGIDWHGHDFDITDTSLEKEIAQERNNATFIGDWSLFTRGGDVGGGIIKPSYNALRALSLFTGKSKKGNYKLLHLTIPEDRNIAAFASISKDDKSVLLLLSKFMPTDTDRLNKNKLSQVETELDLVQQEVSSIKSCVRKEKKDRRIPKEVIRDCKSKIIEKVVDRKKHDAIEFLEALHNCSKDGQDFSTCALKHTAKLELIDSSKVDKITTILQSTKGSSNDEAQNIKIKFINLPFDGKITVKRYSINKSNSNSCSVNKQTADTTSTDVPCGIGGDVDEGIVKIQNTAAVKGVDAAFELLKSLGYTNSQLQTIRGIVNQCIDKEGISQCIKKLINNELESTEQVFPASIESDLIRAIRKYKNIYSTYYYTALDSINTKEEISFDGSLKESTGELSERFHNMDIQLSANSVWLIMLSKE